MDNLSTLFCVHRIGKGEPALWEACQSLMSTFSIEAGKAVWTVQSKGMSFKNFRQRHDTCEYSKRIFQGEMKIFVCLSMYYGVSPTQLSLSE